MSETVTDLSFALPDVPGWIYPALVRAASEAIIVVDRDGAIQIWNPAAEQLFGYTSHDMLGEQLDAIIPERLRAAHNVEFQRAVESATTKYKGKVMTTRAVHKNGSKVYIDMSFSLLTDNHGKVAAVAAVARDVTERYLDEAQAHRTT